MAIVFGIIFWLMIVSWKVSADIKAVCLFLWLIAAVIEVNK